MEISALWNLTQIHNGLIYLDDPLEVGGQVVYFVKITPYGGILEIGTHAQNFIVDGIYDLVTYQGTKLVD